MANSKAYAEPEGGGVDASYRHGQGMKFLHAWRIVTGVKEPAHRLGGHNCLSIARKLSRHWRVASSPPAENTLPLG
jgi:hypothetical protein